MRDAALGGGELQAGRVPSLADVVAGEASRGPGAPCDWCGKPIAPTARVDAETCGVICRKRRWRHRRGLGDVVRDASLPPAAPAAPASGDASRGPGAPCDWCGEPIALEARVDAETCGVVCRKRRWRFRQAVPTSSLTRATTGRVP